MPSTTTATFPVAPAVATAHKSTSPGLAPEISCVGATANADEPLNETSTTITDPVMFVSVTAMIMSPGDALRPGVVTLVAPVAVPCQRTVAVMEQPPDELLDELEDELDELEDELDELEDELDELEDELLNELLDGHAPAVNIVAGRVR